jgi:hypothetical protein
MDESEWIMDKDESLSAIDKRKRGSIIDKAQTD